MSLGRRIGRNALAKIIGEVLGRGAGFAFYFLLARWLGADAFGRYSLAFAYATLFSGVVDLGTNVIVTREIARQPGQLHGFVTRINALKLASTTLFFAVLALSLPFAPRGVSSSALVLAAGVLVATTMMLESVHAVMSGLERMELEAASKVISKIALLAGAALGHAATHQLAGTVAGLIAGAILSLAISNLLLRHIGGSLSVRWDLGWNRHLLAHSLPLVVSGVFWNFYDNQDVVLLGYLGLSAALVGSFAAAMKLIDTIRVVPVLITGALFPVLSAGALQDRGMFNPLAGWLIRVVLVVAVPIAMATSMLAPQLVRLAFGAEFAPAAAALRVGVWAILGIFVNHVLIHLLVALDLQRRTILGAVGAAVVNLGALLLLTPRWGLPGAATSLIVSEVAFLGINLLAVRAGLPRFWSTVVKSALPPLAAGAVMAIALRGVGAWPPALAILVAFASYALGLLVFRGLPVRPVRTAP